MSEETSNNIPNAVPASTAETVNQEAKGSIPGEKSQAELESMSGAELAKYFADQKAKESSQPRANDGKFAPKEASNPIKEAAKEAIENVRKYKVKVDGAELEVDENELLRGYSHQKAANKILQEGKSAKKQAEEFIKMMKDEGSLFDVVEKLGHNPRDLAEKYLARQLQEELMDPREKEFRDAQRKLKAYEDMERKEKEAQQRAYHDQMKKKYEADYNTQFVKALQETGLPPTKPMVAEMAKYISRSAKLGYEMNAKEAAQLVLEDIQSSHRRLIHDADGDTLMKLLGEDVANKIRKYDVAKIKTPEQVLRNVAKEDQSEEMRERKSGNKRMTPAEWREFNRKGKK